MIAQYISFCVYALLLRINAEEKMTIKVKVLTSSCSVNGHTDCGNRFLQLCYHNKNICGGKMSVDCLLPPDFNQEKTNLKAVDGSSFTFIYTDKIESIMNVIIGITKTSRTSIHPFATSCEVGRNQTSNGFIIKTRSAEGSFQFELLVEVVCTNLNCSGKTCDICGNAHLSTTKSTSAVTSKGLPFKLTTKITKGRIMAISHSKTTTNKEGHTHNSKYVLTTSDFSTRIFARRDSRLSSNAPGNINNQSFKTITGILIANTFILFVIAAIVIVGIVSFVKKSIQVYPVKNKVYPVKNKVYPVRNKVYPVKKKVYPVKNTRRGHGRSESSKD